MSVATPRLVRPGLMAFDTTGFDTLVTMLRGLGLHLLEVLLPADHDEPGRLTLSDDVLEELLRPLRDHKSFWRHEPLRRTRAVRKSLAEVLGTVPLSRRFRWVLLRHLTAGRMGVGEDQVGIARQIRKLQRARPRTEGDAACWSVLMGDLLKLRMEGNTAGLPPYPFWQVFAERAWGDLSFRMDATAVVRTHFLERELLDPHQRAFPAPHRQTLWSLIALARPAEKRRFGNASLHRSLARLRGVALRAAKAREWAGFWDQWLLQQALALRPSGNDRPTRRLRETIDRLPIGYLLETGRLPPAEEADHEDDEAVEPLEADAEDAPRQPPKRRPMKKQIEPAAPEWTEQIPDWLEALRDLSMLAPKQTEPEE